ncbi:MAG: gamma-glutamyl-gamma-aminobutyrate hydrolase family protein [Acidobacteria bacterium]|nr:gamma-glutamyl-gamma-aminobutyrate hydrolase family protein [Acidobacteriota bacterium]MCI0627558.1 gamma-glutamyl-gamma-aminobutyrate hydrolase family protein [Acidobacteriota bacterium]MCI0717496.1 gamma-glutamyl-gamma-aminobutyrate hydrolase family protein [Acidobacteriota bacterium]
MAKRPLIGIPCRIDAGRDRFYLRKHYSEALFHAGGTPVLLPLIPEKIYAEELVRGLDAILISGSNSDVDPHRYGQEPHPKIGSVVTRRDETDLFLLDEVFRARKPLLGICFGVQILNVYLGGTLWQDVESQVKQPVKHEQTAMEDYRSHTIRIKPRSLLHRLAQQTQTRVNSFHHQAIQKVAPSLVAVAESSDGIVEAVELRKPRQGQFVLGVQWHPEIGWETDELSQKIFTHFVEAARNSAK